MTIDLMSGKERLKYRPFMREQMQEGLRKISFRTVCIRLLESRGKSNYQEAECNIEKVVGSVWAGWNFIKAMEGAIE